jgi:hypothetical protein
VVENAPQSFIFLCRKEATHNFLIKRQMLTYSHGKILQLAIQIAQAGLLQVGKNDDGQQADEILFTRVCRRDGDGITASQHHTIHTAKSRLM